MKIATLLFLLIYSLRLRMPQASWDNTLQCVLIYQIINLCLWLNNVGFVYILINDVPCIYFIIEVTNFA